MNSWVLALTTAAAETIALAGSLELDPQLFLDTIKGGPLDVAYAHVKGAAMLKRDFPPAFPADGAAKDAQLIVAAGRAHALQLRVAEAVAAQMKATAESGHARDDMAAVIHAITT